MSTDPTSLDPITTARVIVTSPDFETIKAHSDPEWRGLAQIIETLALAVARMEALADRFEAERDTSRTEEEAFAWDNAATLVREAMEGGQA